MQLDQRIARSHLWRLFQHLGIAHIGSRLFWAFRLRGKKTVSIKGLSASFDVSTQKEWSRVVNEFHGEREILERFLTDLRPDDTVWDVGACIGTHAVFTGFKIPNGDLVVIEPANDNFERLRKHLSDNSLPCQVTSLNVALGTSDQDAKLVRNGTMAGEGTHFIGDAGTVMVRVRSGASLIKDGVPKPTVVKIDVEGAEAAVVEGFGEYLNDVRMLLIEIHPGSSINGFDSRSTIELLEARGFKIQTAGERGIDYTDDESSHFLAFRRQEGQ